MVKRDAREKPRWLVEPSSPVLVYYNGVLFHEGFDTHLVLCIA